MNPGRPVLVAPSLLSADFSRLGADVAALEDAGADWLHFDVMDGRFVPNITIGPVVLKAVRRATRLPIDVHLMIVEPERYVEAFAEAGADRLTVHAEASPNLHRTLGAIREAGMAAGVAFNPGTPLALQPAVLELLDQVPVMTVNPGFAAQDFIPGVLPKIEEAAGIVGSLGHPVLVQVDGGIDAATAKLCRGRGAGCLVSGNYVFGHPDGHATAIAALRS